MQNRSTGAVYGPDDLLIERHKVLAKARGIFRVKVQKSAPAASNTDNVVAFIDRPVNERLDARVQPWNISTAGENSYCLSHREPSFKDVATLQKSTSSRRGRKRALRNSRVKALYR